ncbi:MAG: sensory rhodopsin transducer [Myxococcota bacterium]
MSEIGARTWAIAEGYIPTWSTGEGRALESHETLCVLNTRPAAAEIAVTIYFADREPVGPYSFTVEARRTKHLRFNDLKNPEVPRGHDFAAVVESDRPVVVQHTRLDSRQAENSIMTTVAYPGGA